MNFLTYLYIFIAAFFAFFGIAQIVFLNSKIPATILRCFCFAASAVLTAVFINLAVSTV